jgi:GAF domain-containing protein
MSKTNYESLLNQIKSITESESNKIANLANTIALIHENLNTLWTGFYFVEGDDLVLGPFQGPVACTRIKFGKGVCGKAWSEKKTLRVSDVHAFDGHIACSALSNSEIVIPLRLNNEVVGVLDIDSTKLNHFKSDDEVGLGQIVSYIEKLL